MSTIKTIINANIRQNGNRAITGNVLNGVLNAMVDDADGKVLAESERAIAVEATKADNAAFTPVRDSVYELERKTGGFERTDDDTTTFADPVSFAGGVDMDGNAINNVGVPVDLADAVNKEYVDNGLSEKADESELEALANVVAEKADAADLATIRESINDLDNAKADKADTYTKSEVDKLVLLVKHNETLYQYGVTTLAQLSNISAIISVVNRGTIIPSIYERVAWLYEFEEGWRLTHDISGFSITPTTTWQNLLVYLDENSDMLVGSDFVEEALAGKANVSDVYTKAETYTKAEINAMIIDTINTAI